jgi:2-desacetyl-2-hydroxyethyl bacteriochlorophyllide A dehydrogenase
MWTSTLELDPAHVIPTKLLGYIWRGAYFSSFAPLQVRNLPRQSLPASNWVRVRNSLAGICGSDLHLIFVDGDFNFAPAAIPNHGLSYPGHEVVGEVIEVGNDVHHLRVGDRVVLQSGPNCITAGVQQPCRSCASGHYSLCENGALPGPQPIGGGWSEEMLLHEQQLFHIPHDIHDMQAVLLEPTAVAVHAVLRHVPQAKDRVLIIGAGTIGLLILQVVRALAPEAEVCVMARHSFQIEQAARLGAQIIYPHDSYKEIQQATSAQLYEGIWGNKMLLGGYDVIYDTVGSAHTTQDALRWARAGSTVVVVGVYLHRMRIDLTPIWYEEINLIGTKGHGMETWPIGTSKKTPTFKIAVELIQRKLIFPDKLITHSFPLSGFREALMTAANKARNRAIKVVFDYSKQPPSVVPNVRAAARRRQRAITAPIDSRPPQSLATYDSGLSQGASLPLIEEEVPYSAPAVVDERPTTNQEVSPSPDVATIDEMAEETPFATDIYEEADFGTADRVPVLPYDFENEESDTTTVPVSAQFQLEDQSLAFSAGEHEETAVSESATSLAETEKEHSILQEASLPGSGELTLSPAPEVAEEDANWLHFHSLSLLHTDESPSWLQALTPTQADEGEKETPFTATSDINEESSGGQFTTPATTDSESEATQTVDVSASKRSRTKRKTSEQRVTQQQTAHSEESESDQSQPSTLENQEQQESTETAQ